MQLDAMLGGKYKENIRVSLRMDMHARFDLIDA